MTFQCNKNGTRYILGESYDEGMQVAVLKRKRPCSAEEKEYRKVASFLILGIVDNRKREASS